MSNIRQSKVLKVNVLLYTMTNYTVITCLAVFLAD